MADSGDFPKIDGDVFYALDAHKMFGSYTDSEQGYFTATTSDASATLSQSYTYCVVQNKGTVKAFIAFDRAATTNDYDILPGETVTFYGVHEEVHGITSSGSAAISFWSFGSTAMANSLSVQNLSVTNANASLALTATAYFAKIFNSGLKACYIAVNEAATTAKYRLDAGTTLQINMVGIVSVQAITGGTDTTTIKVASTSKW